MSTAPADDDFVLTIFEDEDVPNLDAEAAAKAIAIPQVNGQKRKQPQTSSQNGVKRRKVENGDAEDSSNISPGDASMDKEFDPGFEFEFGDQGGELDDGFDIWDGPNGNKKAIDIDDITRRRKERGEGPEGDSDSSSEASDDDEAQGPEAASEQTSASEEEPENNDNDEVASPVPHPDDLVDFDDDPRGDIKGDTAIEKAKQAAFFAPEVSAASHRSLASSFQTMSLSRPILKGLTAVGFTSPTPIQSRTVPVALLGKDVVGGAVTGSGKTAAFIIPILERLLYRPKKVPLTRVTVLLPTRELAVQCFNVAKKLATFTDITFSLIVGGLSVREQEQALRKRPDVVIATPGRFIDHMRNSASFAVENIEILVLDEADRMLEDGFADELNEILSTIPKSRQTMLFSATMTQNVDKLIRAGLQRPVRIMVDANRQTVQGLVQEFIKMKAGKEDEEEYRLAYLLHLCSKIYTSKTIVFFPRKDLAHRVRVLFSLRGIKAAELHGSMSQEQRLAAISSFRDGARTHLLATDLASRGLDIPHTDAVLNFTVPATTDTYLHRVGRTARAGRNGVACTLFASKSGPSNSNGASKTSERTLLRPIVRLARTQKATIRTRSIPSITVTKTLEKIRALQPEVDAVLLEEKQEKLIQQSERDLIKGQNLVKYEQEIASRPRRTWFQTEKDKKAASQLGKSERSGLSTDEPRARKPKEKKKLSGKDRKRLSNQDDRNEGKLGWKKGKEERAGRGVLKKETKSKKTAGGHSRRKGGKVTRNR